MRQSFLKFITLTVITTRVIVLFVLEVHLYFFIVFINVFVTLIFQNIETGSINQNPVITGFYLNYNFFNVISY